MPNGFAVSPEPFPESDRRSSRENLAPALDEARRFRHVARRAYDDFEAPRATPAVEAAKLIVARIGDAVAAFKA